LRDFMSIYIYRITAGQERVVGEMLAKKVKKDNLPIYAIGLFEDLKGYLLVEAENEVAVRQAAMKMPHIKGILDKPMQIEDMSSLMEQAKPVGQVISKGDVVELISGPFKGEKAKVMKVDENKDEITVELTEVAVPIPVSVKSSTVRIHKKAESA